MTCGMCKHCKPNNICNGDCECRKQQIEVSEDDDVHFYGENGGTCESFEDK